MISEKKFQEEAAQLGVPVASIKAVSEVESQGAGIVDGKPVICFEPHIFWQQLVKLGIDPYTYALRSVPVQTLNAQVIGQRQVPDEHWADVLYRTWGERPYPWGQARRWAQLDKAATINRDAALKSASWGRFQIMGFNYRACGCKDLQEFVNRMYASEDDQLDLFTNYVTNDGLVDALKSRDWALFAERYNGKAYKKNNYDGKLRAAYLKYTA